MEKKLARNELSEKFTKEVQYNGATYLQPWRRYFFSVPINHGLARTPGCLPADLPVVLRFHRAPATFALLKMADTITLVKKDTKENLNVDYEYEENVIPIKSPVLSAYYAYSQELEQSMSKIRLYNFELPFLDYVVRRTVLDSGVSEYDVSLIHGKLPKYLIFGLSSLPRVSGSEDLSLACFQQGDLNSFDLILGERHKKQ